MKKKQTWMGITKGLLLGAALSVSLLFTNDVYAEGESGAETEEANTVVTYEQERIVVEEVKDGSDATGYYFVTTIAPKPTKIPATNKWERTIDGSVDVSAYPNGKTLYFANSTSPAYEEIVTVVVPAQPKFSSIGYAPAAKSDSTMALLKDPKVTVKASDGKTNKVITLKDADVSKIEYRKKDTEYFWNGEKEKDGPATIAEGDDSTDDGNKKDQSFPEELSGFQKSGATLEFRTTSDEKEEAVKGADGIYYFSNAEVLPSAKKDECVAGAFLRPGVIKTVKVTKMAAAPAVTIDFANHSFKVKKGQEYAKATPDFMLSNEYKEVKDKDEVVYFKDNEIYMVRTAAVPAKKKAASLPVFVTTGHTESFARAYGTDNKVTVKGGSTDTTHVMTITRTLKKDDEGNATAALNPAQSYQYAIVDSVEPYINEEDGTLNYEQLDADKSKVKWVTATIKKGQASVNVSLKKNNKVSIVGQQIILRAAKGTNVLSSRAVILTAPKAKTEDAAAVDYWTQKEAGSQDEAKACLNISSVVEYNAASGELIIKAGGAADVAENKKVNITVSTGTGTKKVEKPIESPITVTNGNATIVTSIKELGVAASDKLALTITVPAGTLTGLDGTANAEQKLSATVDTKAPVISVKSTAKDKVTFLIDSPVKFEYEVTTGEGDDATPELKKVELGTGTDPTKTLDKDECAKFIEIYKGDTLDTGVDVTATYTKSAKTLLVEYKMDPTSSADYKVVLKGITDMAGNAVAAKDGDTSATVKDGNITFKFKNPAYVAVESVEFKEKTYEVKQGDTLDLTQAFKITPDDATNKAVTWAIESQQVLTNSEGPTTISMTTDGVIKVGEKVILDCTATVTLTVDGKSTTCTIKVIEKAADPTPDPAPES